jgi:hypothetical protein
MFLFAIVRASIVFNHQPEIRWAVLCAANERVGIPKTGAIL